jgi:hypothetical protein
MGEERQGKRIRAGRERGREIMGGGETGKGVEGQDKESRGPFARKLSRSLLLPCNPKY